MANISDIIESFIIESFLSDNEVTLSRNELASYFSVAPSQINYVLSTRFSIDKGYAITSKRGNGGSITIVKLQSNDVVDRVLDGLDNGLSYPSAEAIITSLLKDNSLTEREAKLLRLCISDKALTLPFDVKAKLRGQIMKEIINELLKED